MRGVTVTLCRLLVTGSRRWSDVNLMSVGLRAVPVLLEVSANEITLVHGAAPGEDPAEGADLMAARLGAELGMVIEPHPACWEQCVSQCPLNHRRVNRRGQDYCPDAGHRRNSKMIDTMSPGDICLAFAHRWASGTGNCARKARRAGLVVQDWGVETGYSQEYFN